MTRRKSQGTDIITDNQRLLLNLIMRNNLNKESSVTDNKSDSMNNITNSCLSCSEDSVSNFNNSINFIEDNNSNLFNNDSILSRAESDLHRINSDTTKLDSIDKTCDESQKYFLNSNNNSFQLEYKKDKISMNSAIKGYKVFKSFIPFLTPDILRLQYFTHLIISFPHIIH